MLCWMFILQTLLIDLVITEQAVAASFVHVHDALHASEAQAVRFAQTAVSQAAASCAHLDGHRQKSAAASTSSFSSPDT
jgi:hypothetical protein